MVSRGGKTPREPQATGLAPPSGTFVDGGQFALAAKRSPASASPRPLGSEASRLGRFQVGDRVEYWSDTYRQWMPGTVQRVRDGGLSFDLDVKKGAQASKLRADRRAGGCAGGRAMSSPHRLPGATQPWEEQVPTAVQAQRIRAELRQEYTRAIQDNEVDWAEISGQDMVSRAGAVTVQKMVETTKALLQGLEGALILRAGFIAGCFHMWRCETTLSRAGRLYQEEFHRHHNEWGIHLEHTRRHYETEMDRLQQKWLDRKDKTGAQQALVLERWLLGDRLGLLRETMMLWFKLASTSQAAARRKRTVEMLIHQWTEGKSKGTAHVAFTTWRHIAELERRHRQKEEESRDLLRCTEAQLLEERRRADESMAAKLREIERLHKDRTSNVEMVLARWEKGSSRGTLLAAMQAWKRSAKEALQKLRFAAMAFAGDCKSTLGAVVAGWHRCVMKAAQKLELQKQQESLEQARVAYLERYVSYLGGKQNTVVQGLHFGAWAREVYIEKKKKAKERRTNQRMLLLEKWLRGEPAGLRRQVWRVWQEYAAKSRIAKRQIKSVQVVLQKWARGEEKGTLRSALTSWHTLTVKEQAMSQQRASKEALLNEQQQQWQEMQKRHKDTNSNLEVVLAAWQKGAVKGMTLMAFKNWLKLYRKRKAARKAEAMIVRMASGDDATMLHLTVSRWRQVVQEERVKKQIGASVDQVAWKQIQKMEKYAEVLASKQAPVLKGLVFAEWSHQTAGLKHELEKEQQRAAAWAEMDRLRHNHEGQLYESRAAVLNLEEQKSELQDRISVYLQEIDRITETLQKELRTKEELALELQNAYRMSRTALASPATSAPAAATGSHLERRHMYSRTSSEQTLCDEPSADVPRFAAPEPATRSPATATPGLPQVLSARGSEGPRSARGGTIGREVEVGLSTLFAEARAKTNAAAANSASRVRVLGAPPGSRAEQADQLFDAMDRNRDGILSRSEFREGVQARIVDGGQA